MTTPMQSQAHPPAALEAFAAALLAAAGMDSEKSRATARLLVLTDMMGRRTHGMAMLPLYAAELAKGSADGARSAGMRSTGEPLVIKDSGATLVWDGQYLPGGWLIERAITQAIERCATHGVVTVAIRKTHHIGCLAALVKQAADQGYVAIIANSDPAGKRVAPYGGKQALFTPDPYAIGYPGKPNPVLVDICASITTTSMTRQKVAEGRQFEHPWLLDADGTPTRDPAVLEHSEPRGSLQLIGGLEYGHKGFGMALMIEALSQGLSGHGRADAPARWGGNVFLQVLSPEFFAGGEAFGEQMDFLSDACRSNPPIDPARPVRMPGDQAARSIEEAKARGIVYDGAVWSSLVALAGNLGEGVPGS
jgi:L-lactate dehydrogenase